MTLQIGSRVGPYEITGQIGKGGMGEVFRARDTNLNRDVAIKVLPAIFAKDADGLSRFRREAQVLAALNHPNIAAIYGLEETNGNLALALELVEGEDLAERLKRGPIPVDEAIVIAKQIAEGLEAAHEKGIIHRDLKPANVKISKSGTTKLLDFGLAKAFEGDSSHQSDVSQTPTMARSMTTAGMIVGTAAYMSPEQARGKPVDKRTDTWAFGVVLYEMLTGRRLFSGETITDTLASVLTRDPDLNSLPQSTPPGVRRLLKRCLNKDPKKRLRDIGDAHADLDDVTGEVTQLIPVSQPPIWRRALPWVVAAVSILMALWMLVNRNETETMRRDVMHLDITYPPGIEPFSGLQGGFAISPDGNLVAMIGIRDGVRRLFLRRLDHPEVNEVSETTGVNSVAFSPDNKSIAYVPGAAVISRISLSDQQRTALATGSDLGSGVVWTSAGIIYTRAGALWSVPAEGGKERQLTTLNADRHEVLHHDPLLLPGGRVLLFSCLTTEIGTERIEAMNMKDGKRSVLLERAITPVWSPTGHLLFGREGGVLAVPFDPETATLRGSAVPVIPSGSIGSVRTGSLGYSLSSNGTLLYISASFNSKQIVLVERDGSQSALRLPAAGYGNPRISPDGKRLLFERNNNVLDALDLSRGTISTLSAPAHGTTFSTWTSDGKGVIFRRFNIPFWTSADGSGNSGTLKYGLLNDYPSAPGPDPDSVIVVRIQPATSADIFLMSVSGKLNPKPIVLGPSYEGGAQLSPDLHWLLYQSNHSGHPEIYIRRYPELDHVWQVSEGGGVQARWNPTGREIFYRNGKDMMAVTFDGSGAEPGFGKPIALFPDVYAFGQGISIPNYDVTHDGRFIMLQRGSDGNALRAVINWTEELKQILSTGGVR